MFFPDQDTLNGGKTQPSRGICEDKPSVVVPTIVNTSQYYVRKIPSDFHVAKKYKPPESIKRTWQPPINPKIFANMPPPSNIMIPCDVCFLGCIVIIVL